MNKAALQKQINATNATLLQKAVWRELLNIKKGTVITYAQLAANVGKPKAVRAVANAVGKNPFAPQVPCHRVIRSDGSLGGYSAKGGMETKKKLLTEEGYCI